MSEDVKKAPEGQIEVCFKPWAAMMNDLDEVALGKWIFILLKDMPYEKVEAITSMVKTMHLQQEHMGRKHT